MSTPWEIRPLASQAEFTACTELQEATWGRGFTERVPTAILLVNQKIGGVTAGAFTPDSTLAGFVFGMTGVRNGQLVHWSDMLAVRPAFRGSGMAEALKRYQADQCRTLGVSVMLWTYDPLVARNAHFNLNKLGASIDSFVENMYGSGTGSVLMGALPTDRFIAAWALDGSARRAPAPSVEQVRVRIPDDWESIVASDPAAAQGWRERTRSEFRRLFADGWRVTGFDRTQGYTFSHDG
ncbi:MAG: hypothetical protein K2X99_12400 [Gemmatimonadaceae bacterium]|nr:hypothetical protein [Gemmatimonadaceae bacterium]